MGMRGGEWGGEGKRGQHKRGTSDMDRRGSTWQEEEGEGRGEEGREGTRAKASGREGREGTRAKGKGEEGRGGRGRQDKKGELREEERDGSGAERSSE